MVHCFKIDDPLLLVFIKTKTMKTIFFTFLASLILFGSSCIQDQHPEPYDYSGINMNYSDAPATYNVDSLYFLLDNGKFTHWASNQGDSINFLHIVDYLNNYMQATTHQSDPLYPISNNFKVLPNGDNSLKFENLLGGKTSTVSCTIKDDVLTLAGVDYWMY